ncbi:PTS sugar transporter subunit IIA [Enterococcus sp. BWT-B8]|uniref:PTS sugar transporter subunit IIA n=1 Tax=Enterococcus sp. BWT-B8 TaxID=2885157 RepID=UPI001E33762B|nr:PTS sugar transporter subunit IIA [Enterococcus sp. BWT-B8]MCB5950873.1 PTS sugar transporter subunit IIA [Enterococcus sp. BWT-B8]
MANVILVAHGRLAVEMKHSLEMIFGTVDRFYPVAFDQQDGLESLEEKLSNVLNQTTGETLILADLFCGTPYNASCSLAMKEPKKNIQVLSGMSLPLVLEIASLIETLPINEIVCIVKKMAEETVQSFSGKIEEEEEEEDF